LDSEEFPKRNNGVEVTCGGYGRGKMSAVYDGGPSRHPIWTRDCPNFRVNLVYDFSPDLTATFYLHDANRVPRLHKKVDLATFPAT